MRNKLDVFREEIDRLERMVRVMKKIGLANRTKKYEFLIRDLRLRFDRLELQYFRDVEAINRLERKARMFRDIGMIRKAREYESQIESFRLHLDVTQVKEKELDHEE